MDLRFIRKTGRSSMGACPSIYATPELNYVVQGERIADPGLRELFRGIVDNDVVVWVDDDVITQLEAEKMASSSLCIAPCGGILIRGEEVDKETMKNLLFLGATETAVFVASSSETRNSRVWPSSR